MPSRYDPVALSLAIAHRHCTDGIFKVYDVLAQIANPRTFNRAIQITIVASAKLIANPGKVKLCHAVESAIRVYFWC